MSGAFTKLFASLLDSTLWIEQPHHVVRVWVAMLAMADRDGFVAASIPGLAHRARVTTSETEEALAVFSSPDRYSRTPDHEGRRTQTVQGGWVLLNYVKYRRVIDAEQEKMRKREYMREKRSADSEAARTGGTVPDVPIVPKSSAIASASLSASRSELNPDPEGAPAVPGLTVVHPGPLQPSKREQALEARAAALSLNELPRHEYTPGWAPNRTNQARGRELGLTDDEMLDRWETCKDKYYEAVFRSDVKQFNRELAFAAQDKTTMRFKSKQERDAFEMPGRERRGA